MQISPDDYRAAAKALFDILNTTRSNNGAEELDKDELAMANKCGLDSIFKVTRETLGEEDFINLYMRAAEHESVHPVRESCFNASCQDIKTCYEDMKKYGQMSFGIDNEQPHPECEVSMNTIMSIPKEGMYTMFKGYKILYTNDLYVCPDIQSENSSIWGLRFEINQDLSAKKGQDIERQLSEASTQEEKNEIIRIFLDNLPSWHGAFDIEFYQINEKTGPQTETICGHRIYFNIDDNYNLTFDYERTCNNWNNSGLYY